jgi:rhodanese-related sulfurtransferase
MKNFSNYGFQSGGIINLTPKETFELCKDGAVIVDVREMYMMGFKTFDVPKVICCPYSMLEYYEFPSDKILIFADATGIHSKESVKFLLSKGFDKIANMAGGLVEWERDELPLIIDKNEKLSGQCMCQLRKSK